MGWVPFGICFVDTWLSSSPRGMVTVVLFFTDFGRIYFLSGFVFCLDYFPFFGICFSDYFVESLILAQDERWRRA